MRSLFFSIGIYWSYFLQFIKTRLEYKLDFLAAVLANVLVAGSGLLFVVFLVDGQTVQSLGGWSREEVLFIYGYSMLPLALFSCVAPNLYGFGDRYVIEGQFDRVLLRPLNSLCQVLFESFTLESVGSLSVGVLMIAYTSERLDISLGLVDIFWLILSSIAGAVILLSVFVAVSSLSFHFEDRLGIAPPVYNLISFSRYPLTIFNRTVQFVLCCVIPFAFVAFFPATHFLPGREGFRAYCYLTPVVAMIALLGAGAMWRFGVSRYASTGN